MKIKKSVVFSLLVLQLLITLTPSTVVAQPITSNAIEITSSNSPKVDDIRWQYKFVGEIMYRRLYNYSTNTPLSDWEIAP